MNLRGTNILSIQVNSTLSEVEWMNGISNLATYYYWKADILKFLHERAFQFQFLFIISHVRYFDQYKTW